MENRHFNHFDSYLLQITFLFQFAKAYLVVVSKMVLKVVPYNGTYYLIPFMEPLLNRFKKNEM